MQVVGATVRKISGRVSGVCDSIERSRVKRLSPSHLPFPSTCEESEQKGLGPSSECGRFCAAME